MRVVGRMDQYRRRRHRAAVKRKGIVRRRHRANCHLRLPEGVSPEALGSADFGSVLGDLIQRICSYPGVRGVLWRRDDAAVLLKIVAPSPMTRPMCILGENWLRGLRNAFPSFAWELGVVPEPPEDDPASWYTCWRDS
ncbi:MAG: hypothetical protein HY900_26475 [Deltaproteobacteria bacterium]|nr:hypothetical protein [Deltaproteobacteria bacterium]